MDRNPTSHNPELHITLSPVDRKPGDAAVPNYAGIAVEIHVIFQ